MTSDRPVDSADPTEQETPQRIAELAGGENGSPIFQYLIEGSWDGMVAFWSPTPWIIDVYTDRIMSDRYYGIRKWCIDHFGRPASPLHGIDGKWQDGLATVHGWTLYGFADRGLMERFITAWPRVSTWPKTG